MTLEVNLDLVKKYQRPGPRYTSYPPAPHFRDDMTVADWEAKLRENNADGSRDLSLYLHLPYCDTLCYFCGCNMVVTRDRGKVADYVASISREIDLLRSRIHPDRKVVQLHFGGGTPTHLLPDEIRALGGKLREAFPYADDVEIGCEMDPRELTRDHVVALREIGCNRASLGVQDHDPKVQKAVHRIQPREIVEEAISWIRDVGIESLNIDLIYGLPHQSSASFEPTLRAMLDVGPDRFAIFNYAHVPWMKAHQKLIREEDLPSGEEKLRMLKMIIETLTSSGYVYVGMDHFAREQDELAVAQRRKTLQRNFQGYSTKAGADIYGFGMSAISQLVDSYAQNVTDIPLYRARVADGVLPLHRGYVLTTDDRIRREVIMTLMCHLEIGFDEMARRTGCGDFREYFAAELAGLDGFEQDGLLVRDDEGFRITEPGRLFVRNVAMRFDAHLGSEHGRYSKTV
jgi:oxygen-independent coproporphyrinogen-3 oxidase